MEEFKNLITDKGKKSKGQWIWVLSVRLFGGLMFVAPLFLPLKAYFYSDIENVTMAGNDVILASIGFFISAGGKHIGILLNSIGVGINNLIKKISS